MFRGIIALFSSGVILNPMVFSGIVFGFVAAIKLSTEVIFEMYSNWRVYALLLLVSFVYNFLFKKVYEDGGLKVDIKATAGNVLLSAFYFIISNALTISFVYMLSFF